MMKRGERRRRKSARFIKPLIIAVILFAAANVGMWAMYRGRALPNEFVGQAAVGGKSLSSLTSTTSAQILPASLTLTNGTQREVRTPAELGVGIDTNATIQSLQSGWQRWLPLLSLVFKHHTAIHFQINSQVSGTAVATLAHSLTQPAMPRHIVWNGDAFAIADSQDGLTPKIDELLPSITSALERGHTSLAIAASSTAAPANTIDLNAALQQLQKELDTQLTFVYGSQNIKPSKADASAWFASDGQTMSVSSGKVSAYLADVSSRLGITIANQKDLGTATAYALGKDQSLSFALVPQTSNTVVRTYCTAVKSVSSSVLDELNGKLAATYADIRGWNDSGRIAFRHVSSGCQYTVWMSAASQMTSFGAICDNYYNCQIGTNVVMNYDRWTSATPPWNQTGGNLEDYHTLMIDHETGHRLGFRDNPTCPGAGQPAPVMMQQSINLKGCVFNIWPRPAEFAQLDQMLGLGTAAPSNNASE